MVMHIMKFCSTAKKNAIIKFAEEEMQMANFLSSEFLRGDGWEEE